jgi:molybdate transport system substrate-binding protein
MGRTWIRATVATFISVSGVSLNTSVADEIRVISANGMREVIAETTAKFETASRHKLMVTVVETGEISKRVLAGEPYDVIMVPSDAADELEKAGKIAPSSAVALIRVNFGLATSSEGPRRDTSTPEGLKRTFLGARTVIITDPATGGISGVHLLEVLDKLGIADEMKSRLVPQRGGAFHAERVVKGEADLAVQAEHEIRCVKGAAFLPYPAVFQQTIVFMGGIGAAAKNADAAKAYLTFMTSSEAATTYTAHCLTPGSNRSRD